MPAKNRSKHLLAAAALLFAVACHPSAQAASCPFEVVANFPVSYINRHIPVITVTIQGQPVRMMVDSGSDDSYLSQQAYNRLNLHETYQSTGAQTTGYGGTAQINAMILTDIQFGAVRVHDEVLSVSDQILPEGKDGLPLVDGLMGYDILQSFDIGLDLPDNQITFYALQRCTAGQTPWTGDFAPASFTRPQGGAPVIPEQIDNQNFNVNIDTGAFKSMVMQNSLRREAVAPEAIEGSTDVSAMAIGNLKIGMHPEEFSSLAIGAEGFQDMWMLVDVTPESDMNAYTDGSLGEDYFATHRVFISNSTATAYLGLSQ